MVSLCALTTARQPTGGYGLRMSEEGRAITEEKSAANRDDGVQYTDLGEVADLEQDAREDRKGLESLEGQDSEEGTLSPDDEMRLQQRRERNRLAAARCRNRRRERAAALVQESDNLEGQNDDLLKDIAELEKEKRKLEEVLRHHLPKCGLQRRLNQHPHNPLLHPYEKQQQVPSHRHNQQLQRYPQHQLLQEQLHCLPQQHCQPNQPSQQNLRYDPQYQQFQQQAALPLNQGGGAKGHQCTFPLDCNQFC